MQCACAACSCHSCAGRCSRGGRLRCGRGCGGCCCACCGCAPPPGWWLHSRTCSPHHRTLFVRRYLCGALLASEELISSKTCFSDSKPRGFFAGPSASIKQQPPHQAPQQSSVSSAPTGAAATGPLPGITGSLAVVPAVLPTVQITTAAGGAYLPPPPPPARSLEDLEAEQAQKAVKGDSSCGWRRLAAPMQTPSRHPGLP